MKPFQSSPDARAACDRDHAVLLDGQALLDYHKDLCCAEEESEGRSLSFGERILRDAVIAELGAIEAYLQE